MALDLVWMLSMLMGYTLAFLMFNPHPRHPWMRYMAIAVALVALAVGTSSRAGMMDIQMDSIMNGTPPPQVTAIIVFFAILAAIAAPFLIVMGMALIRMDVRRIVDGLTGLAGLLF